MLTKNLIIELEIEKIVFGGEGLGFYEEMAVFVPDTLPGDIIKAKVISSKKTYSRALVESFVKKSEIRVEPICEQFENCGGCNLMMTDYENQLKLKKDMLEQVMKKIGAADDFNISEIIPCEENFNYRNKIVQPFVRDGEKVLSGFYRKRTHEIVDNDFCHIQSEISNKIIHKLKELLSETSITIYDEKTHKGFLRSIMLRVNEKNEIMLVFVVNGKKNSFMTEIINKICLEFEEIKSVYISINKKRTNVVLGDENIHVRGDKNISENIDGVDFFIYPQSFFQVNTKQAKILYKTAINLIENIENKIIVDAYAGAGTITSLLAKKAKFVYGIELVEKACEAAMGTFNKNNIKNVEFIHGSVGKKLLELLNNKVKLDTIVFDPPRKGIEEVILNKVAEADIKEIIYISCDPSTFARDLKILRGHSYKLESLVPVDMFPHTSHIELVARLTKGGI